MSSLLPLLSLPLLALTPSPSTSTSLNLLLLSLTWSTLALSYTPLQLEFFAPLALRCVFYLLPSALFLLFDLGLPSLASGIKARGEAGLPGRTGTGTGKGKGKKKQVRVCKVAAWSAANVLLGAAVQTGCEWAATEVLGVRSLIQVRGRWVGWMPNVWRMGWHVGVCLVLKNVLQYYFHSLLHAQNFLARLHTTWHHTLPVPFSIAAAYDHPLPYLLHRFLPLYLPAVALRVHLTTYLLLVALASLEDLLTYSGYTILPQGILLRGMATRVEDHLASGGKGNFGPTGVLDWVHGTTVGGRDVLDDVGDEADAHDVRAKVDGKADGLAGKLKRKAKGRG